MKNNTDIRALLRQKRVKQWQVAMELGISEITLSHWLRFPLSVEKRDMILNAAQRITEKEEEHGKTS